MLTDTKIRQAKAGEKSYRLPDAERLYLEVRQSGAKAWLFRYELPPGKGQIYTIGAYPEISLAEARKARDDARDLVRAGIHPKDDRDRRRQATLDSRFSRFQALAEQWRDDKIPSVSLTYGRQITAILSHDIIPSLGDMPVQDIRPIHVYEALRKIEAREALSILPVARRICSEIFQRAVAIGLAEMDPTAHIGKMFKKPTKGHYSHISRSEIPDLLSKLAITKIEATTAICLQLMLLLFPRPVELRQSEWSEFDLDGTRTDLGGPVWVIPAHRMKMRREHIVPLSRQAVTLLTDLRRWTGAQDYLFPARRSGGTYAAHYSVNRALAALGYAGRLSAHGFRHTASTALHDAGYHTDHIESQLSHHDSTVRGVYNRALYLPERRQMMQDWADMVMPAERIASTISSASL